jgi:hypothetical protein
MRTSSFVHGRLRAFLFAISFSLQKGLLSVSRDPGARRPRSCAPSSGTLQLLSGAVASSITDVAALAAKKPVDAPQTSGRSA